MGETAARLHAVHAGDAVTLQGWHGNLEALRVVADLQRCPHLRRGASPTATPPPPPESRSRSNAAADPRSLLVEGPVLP